MLILLQCSIPMGTVAVAAAPEPLLKVNTLTPVVGQPVELSLNLPTGEDWTQANIGQLVVRAAIHREDEGLEVQRSLSTTPAAGQSSLSYTFEQPGYAMLILDAGPSTERNQSDSWQRTSFCTKVVLHVIGAGAVGEATATAVDPGLSAKVGQRVELLPLISPATIRPGNDLPVRVYMDGEKKAGVEVRAYRPDGQANVQTTTPGGVAVFRITEPGRWMIRFETTHQDKLFIAELVFDVAAAAKAPGASQ